CDFASFTNYDGVDAYFDALKKEIIMQSEVWRDHTFDTVFIGGGTPSSVDITYIAQTLKIAKRYLTFDLKEVTIEANPGTVDAMRLTQYIDMGINRISFGLQAVQDDSLKKIGRIHTFEEAQKSVVLAKRAGFANISVDLMSGLPMQRSEDLIESVQKAHAMDIQHISMYTLKLEKGTALAQEVRQGKTTLPNEDAEYDMAQAARQLLATLGYQRYEISNYAKPEHACLHNLHYWHNDDYLGVGVAAASSRRRLRTTNTYAIDEYTKCIMKGELPYKEQAQSDDETLAFETLMLGLRLTEGVNIVEYYIRHGIQLDKRFNELIVSLTKRGLITFEDDVLCLTDEGMDVQNSVLVEFMEGFKT
ncbi:MAG: radical SAM family heme chaperone HemW, partial [Clostridiales bacterium]|nr:radical SAM family heme chaperone HemW [Clostridiales bacterium]